MEFHTVRIESKKMNALKSLLLKNAETYEVQTKGRYESFRISFRGASIVAYTSGKIVATDSYSGSLLQKSVQRVYNDVRRDQLTIGSDEAGKGEWLGPLVIAAVALDSSQSAFLRSLGVMDSKELKIGRILDLSKDVKKNCLSSKEILLPPITFNQKFDELKKEGKNLNDLLAWGHAKAVSECHKSINEDQVRVVIDEFSKLKTRLRLERVLDLSSITLIQKPHAEDEISVASASILARSARENWLDKKSKELGIDLHNLSPSSVTKRKDCHQIAKISYLK